MDFLKSTPTRRKAILAALDWYIKHDLEKKANVRLAGQFAKRCPFIFLEGIRI